MSLPAGHLPSASEPRDREAFWSDDPTKALMHGPTFKDVRVKGAVGVVELHRVDDLDALRRRFISEGVFIRPFGSVVCLTPSFTIDGDELAALMDAIRRVMSTRA